MTANEENVLLQALRNGDSSAFDRLYRVYADILAHKLHRLVKIHAVVEELHQDVFLKIWHNRHNLEDGTNLKAYLFTIARNVAIDFYRKASKDRELERQLALHIDVTYDHIESMLEMEETSRIIEELISLLPPKRQRVFRLIKLEGKSYEEASSYFGVSMSTIKDHMAKSSDFLKTELSKNYPHIVLGLGVYLAFGLCIAQVF